MDNKIKFIGSIEGLDFYEYKVHLLRYFYVSMAPYEKLATRKVRETLDYVRGGYRTIYVKKSDAFIGRTSITKGGARNKFCTKKDLVIVNTWIQPEYRGFGYANIIYSLLKSLLRKDKDIYAYIKNDNYPSIKSIEHGGFEHIGNASYKGVFKNIVPDDNGDFGIYKLAKEKRSEFNV